LIQQSISLLCSGNAARTFEIVSPEKQKISAADRHAKDDFEMLGVITGIYRNFKKLSVMISSLKRTSS
jgi:hypothetical protein